MGVGLKRMDNKINKTVEEIKELVRDAFCIRRIHMHLVHGRVFTCCLSEHHSPIGNLNEMDLDECYNSDNMKKFRLDMLNGKRIDNCTRCWELEDIGHDTLRKRSNSEFISEKFDIHKSKADIVQQTNVDGSVDKAHLTYMDIRSSNIL